ncbi:MAG: TolC family protein, partial [Nevskiales bacterium]
MTWNVLKPAKWALAPTLLLGCWQAQAMTLSDAYDRAVKHDPLVPYSIALYKAEKERGAQVSGNRLPTVTADGNYTQTDTDSQSQFFGNFSEKSKSHAYGVSLRQPLFRYDWKALGDHADALDEKAEVGVIDRKVRFRIRVAERYFGVLNAQDALR